MTSWRQWFDRIAPADWTERSVARDTGNDNKSVGRWMDLDQPRAEFILDLARAYNGDPIEGLVAAGFLAPRDVEESAVERALRIATDIQLAQEMYRRVADATDPALKADVSQADVTLAAYDDDELLAELEGHEEMP